MHEALICGHFSFFYSVSTQGVSATGNVDYTTETEVVTFQPADTFKDVEITINDDFFIEERESFQLTLTALSNKVTLGSVYEYTIIEIIDDDCKYCLF
jgi:hypothetical protein